MAFDGPDVEAAGRDEDPSAAEEAHEEEPRGVRRHGLYLEGSGVELATITITDCQSAGHGRAIVGPVGHASADGQGGPPRCASCTGSRATATSTVVRV